MEITIDWYIFKYPRLTQLICVPVFPHVVNPIINHQKKTSFMCSINQPKSRELFMASNVSYIKSPLIIISIIIIGGYYTLLFPIHTGLNILRCTLIRHNYLLYNHCVSMFLHAFPCFFDVFPKENPKKMTQNSPKASKRSTKLSISLPLRGSERTMGNSNHTKTAEFTKVGEFSHNKVRIWLLNYVWQERAHCLHPDCLTR